MSKGQEKTGKTLRSIVGLDDDDRPEQQMGHWQNLLEHYDADQEATDMGKSGQDCSTISSYVVDCKMAAEKHRERANWTVVKLVFDGSEEDANSTYLGVKDLEPTVHHGIYDAPMSQADYARHMLMEYEVATGLTLRVKATVGQEGPAPDPEEVPRLEGGKLPRSSVASAGYATSGTRLDGTFTNNQLARYLDKRCHWAQDELHHMMEYFKGTEWYALSFKNAGDEWEDLYLVLYCDRDVNDNPKATGGYLITLEGVRGTCLPLTWASSVASVTLPSSAENETLSWGKGAREALRIASVVETMRATPPMMKAKVDNEALRLALKQGSSTKLGHLRKTSRINFKFFRDCGLIPEHVPGTENFADVMTKVLSRVKLLALIGCFFGIDVTTNKHGTKKVGAQFNLIWHAAACKFRDCVGVGEMRNPANQVMLEKCKCEAAGIARNGYLSTRSVEGEIEDETDVIQAFLRTATQKAEGEKRAQAGQNKYIP